MSSVSNKPNVNAPSLAQTDTSAAEIELADQQQQNNSYNSSSYNATSADSQQQAERFAQGLGKEKKAHGKHHHGGGHKASGSDDSTSSSSSSDDKALELLRNQEQNADNAKLNADVKDMKYKAKYGGKV